VRKRRLLRHLVLRPKELVELWLPLSGVGQSIGKKVVEKADLAYIEVARFGLLTRSMESDVRFDIWNIGGAC
jgi:hypothetical protein